DEAAELRAEATAALAKIDPARGEKAALALADAKNMRDRQNAYRILAGIDSETVAIFLERRVNNIENEWDGARLDLIEAAEKREEDHVKKAVAEYKAGLGADPLAIFFDLCEKGGTAKNGKTIFLTHAAGQCSKCHRIGDDGGEAGPRLDDAGKKYDTKYLLESLVNPSAVVIPGYGITLVTLKGGESVGGALMREDDEKIVLKVPSAEDPAVQVEREIAKSEIDVRQPPVSAMPPMTAFLTKQELRDLVAYLAQQKKSVPGSNAGDHGAKKKKPENE
ncbi:MAG: c-type cytochrome, partial [Verrucomicrobiales bacterium]|nr:c-type cytochrome [Verrucomicrobiales bacterium]